MVDAAYFSHLHRLGEPTDVADVHADVVCKALLDEGQELPLGCELLPDRKGHLTWPAPGRKQALVKRALCKTAL